MLKQVAIAAAVSLVASPAVADLAFTATQQGNDVVFEGTGSLDITGLTKTNSLLISGGIRPADPLISIAPLGSTEVDSYTVTIVGDANFGAGGFTDPQTHDGDVFRFNTTPFLDVSLSVPVEYVSGDPLWGSITFQNMTFADLGVTPGTYSWSYQYEIEIPPLTGGDLPISASLPTQMHGSTITLTVVPESSAFLHGGLISVLAGCGYGVKRRLASGAVR